jgi:hypothetical protein
MKYYASYLLQKHNYSEAGVCEQTLVDTLLLSNDDLLMNRSNEQKSGDASYFNDLESKSLLLVIEWLLYIMKEHLNFSLKDPIEFREEIFEILRVFDFPQYEVDFFLSRVITASVREELEDYIIHKQNSHNETKGKI